MGMPARRWAVPTLKGLAMAAEKPKPTARMLMPSPAKTSQPKDRARPIASGTRGTTSSKTPMKLPMAMKKRQSAARSAMRLARKRSARDLTLASRTPTSLRRAKAPPTTAMKAMMTTARAASSEASTSKGAVAQRQAG